MRPDQVIDFQSLVGDAVDNVPGIPLVGPKKASALLQQFGTLEEVLKNADKAPRKAQRESEEFRRSGPHQPQAGRAEHPLADRSRLGGGSHQATRPRMAENSLYRSGLSTVRRRNAKRSPGPRDAAIAVSGAERGRGPPTSSRRLLGESDAEEEPFVLGEPSDAPVKKKPPAAKPIAAPVRAVPTDVDPSRYRGFKIVDDEAACRVCSRACRAADVCRRPGDDRRRPAAGPNRRLGLQLAGRPRILPARAQARQGNARSIPSGCSKALKPHLQNAANVIVNQNIKYEIRVLRQHGVELGEIGLDPMVGDYLLDAGARVHGLDVLAEKFLGHHTIPIRDLIGTGSKQLSMDQVDIPKVAEYAAEDDASRLLARAGRRARTQAGTTVGLVLGAGAAADPRVGRHAGRGHSRRLRRAGPAEHRRHAPPVRHR